MAVHPIVQYPDPVLLNPTRPIEDITVEVRRLIDDMWETMYAAPGVGLAANQIGIDLRVAVIDTTSSEEKGMHKVVLINPEVIEEDGHLKEEEGCLSFPGFTDTTSRYERVKVRALDIDGAEFEIEGTGLFGRALSHETDHLDGHVFIERMSVLKRDLIRRKIRKLQRTGEWPAVAGV